jgi:small GTP-binding protein
MYNNINNIHMSNRKFVLLGNVDHGKSTLAGRILVNIGDVTEREIEKMKIEANKRSMQSWWLAYLMDTDDSERERGKTVDFIYKSIKWNDVDMTLIDVPGHRNYVPHMANGCSMADIAVVIISARKGEYEAGLKGQTTEHVVIARGMGISTLIVVINKMDTIDWDMTIYQQIKDNFTKKIKGLQFKQIEFVPISAYDGTNVTTGTTEHDTPLMKMICDIPYAPPNHREIVVDETNLVTTKFLFYYLPTLITSGLECTVHTKDKQYDIVIVGFCNDGKPFICNNNNPKKPIDTLIQFKDQPKIVYSNLIVRLHDQTIGLARIVPSDKVNFQLMVIKSRQIAKNKAEKLQEQENKNR